MFMLNIVLCKKNIVNVTYVKKEDQIADMLTKPLVRVRYAR